MSNVKISELPAASTLPQSSVGPFVVSGVTNKVPVSLLNPTVSVLQLGAVGDGITDDTAAITAAIALGKRVEFPFGYTFITQGNTLGNAKQHIVIHGVVKLKNSTNQSVFTVTADRVRIYGTGEIDGNKANQSTSTDSLASGVWVADGISYVEVNGLYIHDCKRNGIAGAGNHIGCKFQDNTIENVAFIGIYPSQSSTSPFTRGVISGNVIISPTQDGIGTVGIQNCSINGNTVYLPGVAGISLEARCDWTTVTGNTVVGNAALSGGVPSGSATGIQVNDSRNVTITGNTVKKCGNGIGVSGGATSQNVTVNGNTIDDCGYVSAGISLDTSVVGSFLAAYEYGITCNGNTILNSRLASIFINGIQAAVVCENYINGFNLELVSTVNRQMAAIVLRNFSHNCTINNNRITDSTGGALKAGIIEVNDGSAAPAKNTYRDNQISGLNQDICIMPSTGNNHSLVVRPTMATAAPAAFTWARGQIQYHSYPASGGSIGWVSTDPRSGSFSTYASTGTITIATASLTVASTDGLFEGMSVSVAGAIAGSWILQLNRTTKVVSLGDNASASVAGAAVTPFNPTFKTWGVIA